MIPFQHGVFATNGGVPSDFELIETQTVGAGGAASVTFSSIPGTYKHLQIRALVRNSTTGASTSFVKMTLNSSASSYSAHSLYGNGTTAGSLNTSSSSYGWACRTSSPTNGSTANVFGAMILDILDYTSTSKNKTTRSLAGVDTNSSNGAVELTSTLHYVTPAAVTSLTFTDESGNNFVQYSTFSLYGVK